MLLTIAWPAILVVVRGIHRESTIQWSTLRRKRNGQEESSKEEGSKENGSQEDSEEEDCKEGEEEVV
jgi:hypothetical protein